MLFDELFGWLERCTIETEPLATAQKDSYDQVPDSYNLYPNSLRFRYVLYCLRNVRPSVYRSCKGWLDVDEEWKEANRESIEKSSNVYFELVESYLTVMLRSSWNRRH